MRHKEALCITSIVRAGEGAQRDQHRWSSPRKAGDPWPPVFVGAEALGQPRQKGEAARRGSRLKAGTTRSLSYFFAGAILESAGFVASAGLVSAFAAVSAGWSMRSTFAVSRSFAT
jgi:hypothetical protein